MQIFRTAARRSHSIFSLGVTHILAAGNANLVEKVARDPAHEELVKISANVALKTRADISTEHHRSLAPLLTELKASGFRIVALEQTSRSVPLTTYAFPAKTALISASILPIASAQHLC